MHMWMYMYWHTHAYLWTHTIFLSFNPHHGSIYCHLITLDVRIAPFLLISFFFFHLIPQPLFFIIWLTGDFVPNAISEYDNAHRRLDIFRCNIPNSEAAYRDLVRSDHEMTVEILNVDKVMIMFTIPWATRVQGKYLTRPDSVRDKIHSEESSQAPLGSSSNPRASVFDPWMGFNNSSPGVWKREKLIMCVSDIEKAPSRKVR